MYRLIRHYRLYLLIPVIIILISGCSSNSKQQGEHISETRLLLDTYCTITIHGDVDSELLDEAFMLCGELEALLSMTIEGSDVWRINFADGGNLLIDPRTYQVIEAGLAFGEISGGLFDINIGRLTRLWDFGSGDNYVPSEAEINKASAESVWIDLGAIAKGYIADMIIMFLVDRGVTGAMVDLGGDVVTLGNRSDGDPWRIALRRPFGSLEDWIGVIEVSGQAVVSSGVYERSFEKEGNFYHHILDPGTGMPVKTDVVSATVIAESALIGEGLSTIAVLVGSDKALAYFEQNTGFLGAVLVLDSGEILRFGDLNFIDFADENR